MVYSVHSVILSKIGSGEVRRFQLRQARSRSVKPSQGWPCRPPPQTQDPPPQTQDPPPQTQDPEPQTQDPEPQTQDPEPQTQDPEPQTQKEGQAWSRPVKPSSAPEGERFDRHQWWRRFQWLSKEGCGESAVAARALSAHSTGARTLAHVKVHGKSRGGEPLKPCAFAQHPRSRCPRKSRR